jgi:hypothetical protein
VTRFRVSAQTAHMTPEALNCRALGTHALESIASAAPPRLRGVSLVVDLYCKRHNPADPRNPFMCGYHREVEYSLRDGSLVSSVPRYPSEGYLKRPEDAGTGQLDRGDVRLALFDRMTTRE